MTRVAIVTGSRRLSDSSLVIKKLSSFLKNGGVLVHGGADGADSIADEWGRTNPIVDVEVFKPNYARWPGRTAPLIRNWEMMAYGYGRKTAGDRVKVFAFPLPGTGGTLNAIQAADHYGLRMKVVE